MNIILICLLTALLITGDKLKTDDPTPYAHDGLGCMTDSECEGVEDLLTCDEDCIKEQATMFPQTNAYTIRLKSDNIDVSVMLKARRAF